MNKTASKIMNETENKILANVKFNLLNELKLINTRLNKADESYTERGNIYKEYGDYDKDRYKRDTIIEVLFDMANAELGVYIKAKEEVIEGIEVA